MKHVAPVALALALGGPLAAQSADGERLHLDGQMRLQWDGASANPNGPLAYADARLGGSVSAARSGPTLQTEVRTAARHWNATLTVQHQPQSGAGDTDHAWLNELAASFDAGQWQFSAGKKIVSWDVGYAFRPNDLVQQEQRRALVSSTAEGRPLLMAEYLGADSAWSLVGVNPTKASTATGAAEPALAARYYQRQGSVDWNGFARIGSHTGASLGAAAAWVAGDALELHASGRVLHSADTHLFDPQVSGLASRNPWQPGNTGPTGQALLGGTWTHANGLSVLLETWWDGTARTPAQWRDWQRRNQWLAQLPAAAAPAAAIGGNLAWQADAFNAAGSLQRSNVYLRLGWTHEGWQPALDVLYHPADGGRMWTAALLWQGERWQLQGGVRVNSGPQTSVIRQLPTRHQAYLTGNWSF